MRGQALPMEAGTPGQKRAADESVPGGGGHRSAMPRYRGSTRPFPLRPLFDYADTHRLASRNFAFFRVVR
jgi:hypothetical protein